MTTLASRNGYTRLPTVDPDIIDGSGATGGYGGVQYGPHRDLDAAPGKELNSSSRGGKNKSKRPNLNHKPGLFHMFGDRWKYAANHGSVAIASHSESEQDAEKIELIEIRSKRPKLRRGRIKSNSKSPKSVKPKQPRFKFSIIEEPVLPGDTVQRVALRYSCPRSEIRRVNNLYKDQDFYALKTVKIPVRENGILTDPKAREKCRNTRVEEPYPSSGGATSDELRLGGPTAYYRSDDEGVDPGSAEDADDEVGDSDSAPEVRDVSIQSALKWKHSQQALLQKFDEDLQKVRENTEQRLANLNEVALTMTSPAIQPIVPKKRNSYEKSVLKMPEFDWRWGAAAAVVLFVMLLAGALIYYVIYTKYLHPQSS